VPSYLLLAIFGLFVIGVLVCFFYVAKIFEDDDPNWRQTKYRRCCVEWILDGAHCVSAAYVRLQIITVDGDQRAIKGEGRLRPKQGYKRPAGRTESWTEMEVLD
jgi:hypothetical protein